MKFICQQVSCHNTPLPARETLAFTQDQQRRILENIRRRCPGTEVLVLCTCNRTEFYLYLPQADDADACIEKAVRAAAPGAVKVWKQNRHRLQNHQAIEHLFAVACGLDSQALGEYQIVRQLKDAYSMSVQCCTSRFFLHRLMHAAFRASKEVRSKTSISSAAQSISRLAADLAGSRIELAGACLLVVGAGESAALAAEYLYKSSPAKMIIASRTLQSASELAKKFKNASALTLEQVPPLLEKVDLALFSTASPQPVITAQNCAYFTSHRKKPLLIIDIAVPRDVEPDVGKLSNVHLVNIDDLNNLIEQNSTRSGRELEAARQILHRHWRLFANWLESLDIAGLVARLQQTYFHIAAAHARRYRRHFTSAQYDTLERFSVALAKKFLHTPISYLKDSSRYKPDPLHTQAAELIGKILLQEDLPDEDK